MVKQIEVNMQIKTASNGNKFPVYSAKMKDNKYIQMKFTKECCNEALNNGFKIPENDNDEKRFIIITDSDNLNLSKNGLYNVVWVRSVASVTSITRKNDCEDIF